MVDEARSLDLVFEDYLNAGKLKLPFTLATGQILSLAARPAPRTVEWRAARGDATLLSWTVYWKAYGGQPVPYNVAWIELDEGVRLVSRVVDMPARSFSVGMRVRARIESTGLLVFAPVDAPNHRILS